jgi:hypothetical protein
MVLASVLVVSAGTARRPWLAGATFAVFIPIAFPLSKRINSNFYLVVGRTEKHEVHFWRNQWTDRVRVTVDVVTQLREIGLSCFASPGDTN